MGSTQTPQALVREVMVWPAWKVNPTSASMPSVALAQDRPQPHATARLPSPPPAKAPRRLFNGTHHGTFLAPKVLYVTRTALQRAGLDAK
jgi:hypothetical protein